MSEVKVLEIEAGIQIQKSAAEIFDAIVDPAKMSNYFIACLSAFLEFGINLRKGCFDSMHKE